ncbi:hypothetical protein ACIA5D_04310 [Actinoplanes sp. NPDC051513]|uniref:hypothetical protein n=1 Tax=Actinoplanes sp. NPDC051513 TaxID=3363908 RepID=UPI003792C775
MGKVRLIAACVLVLALGGCAGPAAQVAAEPKVDAKALLAASTEEMKAGDYAFTVGAPDAHGMGVVHLPSRSAKYTVIGENASLNLNMEVVLAGGDAWVRATSTTGEDAYGEGLNPKTWRHVAESRIAKGHSIDLDAVGWADVSPLLTAVIEAHGDGRVLAGTLNATEGAAGGGFLNPTAVQGVARAASAPFTATLDDRGRLTSFEVDLDGKWTLTVSGYGEQQAVAEPSGAVAEASETALEWFNS